MQLAKRLRKAKYDVSVDARGDIRANMLLAAAGIRRRIGFDVGGGWLLTDAVKADLAEHHKTVDWLRLVFAGIPGESPEAARTAPRLELPSDETAAARRTLGSLGASARPVIAFHPGGSHTGKRWPLDRFAETASRLRAQFGGTVIAFLEPGGFGRSADWPDGTVFVEAGLRELMAMLTCCDVLVCNDSGPMHIADALGVPVVALFERGNPDWYGPSGMQTRVIRGAGAGGEQSTRPVDAPPANPVPVERVVRESEELLRELGFSAAAASN
jgi:ADP-heptose:LPS heptosyltransferase